MNTSPGRGRGELRPKLILSQVARVHYTRCTPKAKGSEEMREGIEGTEGIEGIEGRDGQITNFYL